MKVRGVRILDVARGSAAASAGLRPGDRILAVDGHETPDELALRFHLAGEAAELCVVTPGGDRRLLAIDLETHPFPGLTLEEFETRTCQNACLFCFVDQLPPGARPALCVKDDDYRLSFLHGNYVTLTNTTRRDLDRIVEERLSPLYVSVHASDPLLRARILGRRRPDDLFGKMRRLLRGGIRIHAQIVLMPGINDGARLEQTVSALYALHPGVRSVAIVPVGLSDHGAARARLRGVTPGYARALIAEVSGWQERFYARTGSAFAFLADEFYLQAEAPVPESGHYGDFAQIEDGIGMVRTFLDDFEDALARRRPPAPPLRGTLVTGSLFFPVLERCIGRWNRRCGMKLRVLGAENRHLGSRITVAGLLAGRDILEALAGRDPGDWVIVPGEALSVPDGKLLDDLTLRDLSARLGRPVYSGGRRVRDFFRLLGRLRRRKAGLGL
jgi:putative radical SAM enzyme (TIGR03279 family)